MQKRKVECICVYVCSRGGERRRGVKTLSWSGMSEGSPAVCKSWDRGDVQEPFSVTSPG